MIEAVSSVLINATLLRQSAQQVVSAAFAPAEEDTVSSGPVAPYVDRISMDTNFDTAVLELRDGDTGDVLKQYPSESTLEARQRAEAVRDRAESLKQLRADGDAKFFNVSTQDAEAAPLVGTSQQQVNSLAQAAPTQSQGGPGLAQAAIAALSTGAVSGQTNVSQVSVDT
ncbi:MAG: hypothetical protein KTR28_00445 [Micavibrio sp.]|nr:hypothetical protein [Micavibrio sp.]